MRLGQIPGNSGMGGEPDGLRAWATPFCPVRQPFEIACAVSKASPGEKKPRSEGAEAERAYPAETVRPHRQEAAQGIAALGYRCLLFSV